MKYLGDFSAGQIVRSKFNTADPTGAPITASSVTVKVYKDGSTSTETTTGVTHTEDFDSVTGLHDVAVDTSADGSFYAAGSEFTIVATAITVNGISLAGLVLGQFSIQNRADSAGVTTLLSRLSSTRAGYLDNLSAGAVALEASLQGLITTIGASAAGVASAVWSAATRLLTAGTNIVLAKGTGVTGFNDPTVGAIADQVWEEAIADHSGTVGSTAEALSDAGAAGTPPTVVEIADEVETRALILTSAYDAAKTAAQAGDAMALTSSERTSVSNALLDLANAVETGLTVRGSLRLALAALSGELSGAATSTITFRNAVADSKDRIVATVDGTGNRTAITTDVT